jgi:hypothetical protein
MEHGGQRKRRSCSNMARSESELVMRSEKTQKLFLYWDRLRNGRAAPRRTEIEPADIKTLLADTFILECDARGEAVFRLAGTHVCAIYGRELKGFAFDSLWPKKDGLLFSRLLKNTFSGKQVLITGFEGISRNERVTPFEMIVLPLDGGAGSPRALGAMIALERPFWLGADPIVRGRITSVRVVDPDREPLFLKNRPSIAVPPLEPGRGAISPIEMEDRNFGKRIRHLVVLDGGKSDTAGKG